MDDTQLQELIGGMQKLSEGLALDLRFVDAALVAGGIQAIRALRTRLEPAPVPASAEPPAAAGGQPALT